MTQLTQAYAITRINQPRNNVLVIESRYQKLYYELDSFTPLYRQETERKGSGKYRTRQFQPNDRFPSREQILAHAASRQPSLLPRLGGLTAERLAVGLMSESEAVREEAGRTIRKLSVAGGR